MHQENEFERIVLYEKLGFLSTIDITIYVLASPHI